MTLKRLGQEGLSSMHESMIRTSHIDFYRLFNILDHWGLNGIGQ